MLERRSVGQIPAAPHTQLRASDGRLLWEHCITRQGFDGAYTIAYHERRPHEALPASDGPVPLAPADRQPERLLRRHYTAPPALTLEPFPRHRGRLLENRDLAVSLALPTRSDAAYFANADGDELYFVHSGSGTLRSLLGDVSYRAGDYVYVPRSLLHRFVLDAGAPQHWLVLELRHGLAIPSAHRNRVGQLRMDAPYSHRDFRAPVLGSPRDEGLRDFWLKAEGRLHKYQLVHSPLDVVGWDGSLYPFAFSIEAFKPKVGKVHLPPPVHATFEAPGALICSFVPRPLDFHEQAVPCPYPHSSVDVDEVLFYSRGNFTSRRGVGPGSISHHPRGIPHGPHPGAYEASLGARWTDELAVMLDCTEPLTRSELAESLEDAGYHASFVEPGGSHSTG